MDGATHTPGPWTVVHADADFESVIRGDGYRLAYVHQTCGFTNTHRDIRHANARLIAAAVSSYDKHCGTNAVAAAEDDLLGEALRALKLAEKHVRARWGESGAVAWQRDLEAVEAVLAKASKAGAA